MTKQNDCSRRTFMAALGAGAAALAFAGCTTNTSGTPNGSATADSKTTDTPVQQETPTSEYATLPPAEPDPDSMFGTDKHVTMGTIDKYIASGATDGTCKMDMRMVDDPAHYEAIGGDSKLSMMIEGFTVVPYPYVGTLQTLPVEGAYSGETLFSVKWDDAGNVVSISPNYQQAPDIISELFPKDKPILLMCGGGGYAGMMRKVLIALGWDATKLYNIGGMWEYTGNYAVQLISYADPAKPKYFLWRAIMPVFDFNTLQ